MGGSMALGEVVGGKSVGERRFAEKAGRATGFGETCEVRSIGGFGCDELPLAFPVRLCGKVSVQRPLTCSSCLRFRLGGAASVNQSICICI